MEVINGVRANSSIYLSVADDYAYHANRNGNNGIVYLRCKEKYCSATAVYCTRMDIVLKSSGVHAHPADLGLRQRTQLKEFMKRRAMMTNESFETIFLEGQRRYPEIAAATGDVSFFRSALARVRAKTFGRIPRNLIDLDEAMNLENNAR